MKKAKNIAPLIMLLGGAVTVAVGFIWKVVERNFKEEEPPAEEGGQEGQEETEGASENSEEEREAEENLNTEGSENEGPS